MMHGQTQIKFSLRLFRIVRIVVRERAPIRQKVFSANNMGRGSTVTCDVYFTAIINFTITKRTKPLEIRKGKVKFTLETTTEAQE